MAVSGEKKSENKAQPTAKFSLMLHLPLFRLLTALQKKHLEFFIVDFY